MTPVEAIKEQYADLTRVQRGRLFSRYFKLILALVCGALLLSGGRGLLFYFLSSRGRHTRSLCDWSSDVCSSDLTAFSTPGHAAEHNCYLVQSTAQPAGAALLISGDLIFAGSLGGGYFCCQRQLTHSRRIMGLLAGDAVIAPGHGPLTTAANERRFNPFLAQ